MERLHWPLRLSLPAIPLRTCVRKSASTSRRARAVWLVYPALHLAEIYDNAGSHTVTVPGHITDQSTFPGLQFSLSLAEVFEADLQFG
jgi:hypothetical protein